MTFSCKDYLFPPVRSQWSYHFRWVFLSITVGVVSGLGAVFFDELLGLTFKYCIQLRTGYVEPGRDAPAASILNFSSNYNLLLILIPALGGLISGLLVFLIAPEAEGHGTDAMIDTFHQRGGYIRKRVPFVKTSPRLSPSAAAALRARKGL